MFFGMIDYFKKLVNYIEFPENLKGLMGVILEGIKIAIFNG